MNDVQTANPGPLTAWQRVKRSSIFPILVFMACFAVFAIGLDTAASAALHALKIDKADPELSDAIVTMLTAIGAVAAFWIMVRYVEKRPWASGGFAWKGVVSETAIGFLIGMSLLSVTVGIMVATGVYHLLGINPHFRAAFPLMAFLGTAVIEETIFRGCIFQSIERQSGTGIAMIATAGAFGLAHLVNPVSGMSFAEKLAGPIYIVFEAGILLAAAYLLTRRLWLPIGIHWAWNFFEGPVYGATVSGLPDSNTLFRAKIAGPFFETGGAFGPEGSVACLIVGTVLGLLLLRLAIKKGQWKPGIHRQGPQAESETEIRTGA